MSPSNTRLLALSGTAIALGALTGCSGGEAEQPAAGSPTPSPSLTTTAPPTPDPWAGYFDDEVTDAEVGEYLWQSWGTFGDGDEVAPRRGDNRTVEPGTYTVTLECAGPEMMTGRITTTSGTAVIDPLSVSCMAATPVQVDLPEKGLLVDLDSGGEEGAYLIRVAAAG
ncbi:hypothetical protein P2P98_15790 [Microbacterium sp. Kw_RZR3]|uniref:hypothetical protein n=1 Tax=Microbacterium sp. Kw_RZR3 TaxID=3032903 RepID=UPI0023DBE465|nr:hypothetical protein [Microbacterium sp. Kw_RZR3]MDF2047627.1 hypothetical protein [Microbacterium sp. Kw_RZR3]